MIGLTSIPEKKMLELLGYPVGKGKILSARLTKYRSIEFEIIPDVWTEGKPFITSVTIPNII